MSTILEALREREQLGTRIARDAVAWDNHDARFRGRVVVIAILALAGAAASLALLLLPRREAPTPRQAVRAQPLQPVGAPPPAHPASVPEAPVKDDPPWARVGRLRPTAPPVTASSARAAPGAAPEPAAPPRTTSPSPPPKLPAQTPDAPTLRVQSIDYSPQPAERAVTLTIDGATVTLHQGESATGVEVQLILPQAVYVRRGANVFAVGIPSR